MYTGLVGPGTALCGPVRIMARRNENGVRLYTRNGYDFAGRFPQIVEAVSRLKVRSCFIDGEAIVVDERGLSTFELLRSWRYDRRPSFAR
jgi:bifunctional non-homologous end joining protein LigD